MILIPILISILVAGWFYHRTIPELPAWRRNLLWFLRSCTLIIIMILLFNPVITLISQKSLSPRVIFLQDISDSMKQTAENRSKSDLSKESRSLLKNRLERNNYDVIEIDFADGLTGNTESTYLEKTFSQLKKNSALMKNVEEFYLFSDGWLHDVNLDFLNKITFPVNTMEVDFNYLQSDLEIKGVNFPMSTYRDDITPFSVAVVARNYQGKAEAAFSSEGKIIQSKSIDFSENEVQHIIFEHSFSQTGLHKLQFSVYADTLSENNPANNVLSSAIQVLQDRSKCLIISDQLHWEIRFLNDALKSLPDWQLEYLQKKPTLKKLDRVVRLQDEIINTTTLVLINSGSLEFSEPEIDLISNFVAAGGGLLLQGREISSLHHLLPSSELKLRQSFSGLLQFNRQSLKYQTFRSINSSSKPDIPPVDYFYVRPKLQAEILAEINNQESSPAMLLMKYDRGKIFQIPLFGLWKWQLRSSGNLYRKFMSDLIVWLGTDNSELFYAFSDKNSYFSSETIRINLTAFDETLKPRPDVNAKLKLFAQDERNIPVQEKYMSGSSSGFFAEFERLDPGSYHFLIEDEITQAETSGDFLVLSDKRESRDHGFNNSLLSYIAANTGGRFSSQDEAKDIGLNKAEQKSLEIKNVIPIYKKLYVIIIFLFCFCLELYLRKRWGLL